MTTKDQRDARRRIVFTEPMTVTQLADELGFHRRTVQRDLEDLEERHLVELKARTCTTCGQHGFVWRSK